MTEKPACTRCGATPLVQGRRWCRQCIDSYVPAKICSKCNEREAHPGQRWCRPCQTEYHYFHRYGRTERLIERERKEPSGDLRGNEGHLALLRDLLRRTGRLYG